MRPQRRLLFALLGLIVAPGEPAQATSARERLLVSTTWLAEHLRDPDLVLLHVGDPQEYAAGHIPGARLATLSQLSAGPSGPGSFEELRLEMLPPELLRERLEELGISDSSRLVVYFGNDWVSPSTRLLFTLDYAGLGDRVSWLDGGQPAWVRAGQSLSQEIPLPTRGKLAPLRLHDEIVDTAFVQSHRMARGFALLDARDPDYYNGTEVGGPKDRPHRAGHIAGARSLPFDRPTTDDLHLRSENELRALFASAGVQPDDTLIVYCHIGQQATAVLFAARTLGREVRLYDGSFEQWSRLPADVAPVELPVAAPSAPTHPAP